MTDVLVYDIETDPENDELLCVGFNDAGGSISVTRDVGPWLRDALADPELVKVTFTKYDATWLRRHGYEVAGPQHDLQVMAWVHNENQPLDLDSVSQRYLGEKMDKRLKRSSGRVYFVSDEGLTIALAELRPDKYPVEWAQMLEYNRRDVEQSVKLYEALRSTLVRGAWWYYFENECVPVTEVLTDMQVAGMPVNLAKSEHLRLTLEATYSLLEVQLREERGLPRGFNLNSGPAMRGLLYPKTFELKDTLNLGEWEIGALKSCIAGEHDDCFAWADGNEIFDGDFGDVCVQACLPRGFTTISVGRTAVHGVWTLKGFGAPVIDLVKKCMEKKCDHRVTGERCTPAVTTGAIMSNVKLAPEPWIQKYLEFRRVGKVLSTYLRPMPERAKDGRVYGKFNQTGTKTGRLSSSEPNLQNIPAHGELGPLVRGIFEGNLVIGDYSQLEPRLIAHFSGDPVLTAAYREGTDVYRAVAAGIFGVAYDDVTDEQRGIGKTLVLAMGYGAGAGKVARILSLNGYPTHETTARGYLDELHGLLRGVFAWREAVIDRAKSDGYVTTLSGRLRRVHAQFEDRKNWKLVGYGERQAVNAVVQGSAADVVQRVMVATAHPLSPYNRLIAQVHDELLWEIDGAVGKTVNPHFLLGYLKDCAEERHGFDLRVPLVFEPDFCANWAEKGGYEVDLSALKDEEDEDGEDD